jgi:hypothetical protein
MKEAASGSCESLHKGERIQIPRLLLRESYLVKFTEEDILWRY